jgi:hypothetical protein
LAYHVIDNDIVEIDDVIESIFNDYLPKQSFIINNPSDIGQLYQSKINFSHIFVNSCTNPVNVERQITKIDIKSDFCILTNLYKYHNQPMPNGQIKYFPFWAIWSSHRVINYNESPKKYKLSCLNGTPWEHRKLIYLGLSQKLYFKDMIFTFGNRKGYQSFPSDLKLTSEEQENFSQLSTNVTFLDSDSSFDIDVTTNHPAYTDSYLNLVTETNIFTDTPMLSEKTFKPILAGQLFILLAAPGAVQFLRDVGLDTFDDIIDHSYDNVVDIRDRLQQILNQLDQLIQLDLEHIHRDIKPRLKKNSEFLRSQEFRNQFNLNFG